MKSQAFLGAATSIIILMLVFMPCRCGALEHPFPSDLDDHPHFTALDDEPPLETLPLEDKPQLESLPQHRKMQELVETQGYPLETHFVTTKDGYVLGIFRIPHGRAVEPESHFKTDAEAARPPVLLQHGLLDSSGTWAINFPQQSLAFILADAGYDVWLGNSRGNAFSRNHTGFSPSSAAFWDFSFDDMAEYDFPAVLHYILGATTQKGDDDDDEVSKQYKKRIAYVGHSQGATQAFAALSAAPELQQYISICIALGPAIYVRYTSSVPLLLLAQMQADQLFDLLGRYEILPARKTTADIFGQVCRASPLACVSILTAICGFNENNLNMTRLPIYVEYAPSGTSVKNVAHWAQLIRKSAEERAFLFRRYDYGSVCVSTGGAPRNCNMKMYGMVTPPSFNLSALTDVPLAIFSGVQDILADPVDVERLLEALPPGAVVYTQSELSFQHIDFTWGLSSAERIYPAVLRLLREYHHGYAPVHHA